MARIETEIETAMDADIATEFPTLTKSGWAYFLLFRTIIAKAIRLHEMAWDAFQVIINGIAANAIPGTAAWYQKQALAFQFGDPVVFVNNAPGYAVIDATKQVVQLCAVINTGGGTLLFKAASLAAAVITPLTADQQTGLLAYLNKVKFAGDEITVLSDNPDILNFAGDYYFDAQYALADVKASIDALADAYLSSLDFNGIIYQNDIYAMLRNALGYKPGLLLSTAQGKPSGGAYINIGQFYNPKAGYVVLNAPFSEALTFNPISA